MHAGPRRVKPDYNQPPMVALVDRLYPPRLAITPVREEFRAYAVEFTSVQFRMALWLALLTYAVFGIWDGFGQTGGVETTRFRYLIACPIMALFAAGSRLSLARAYRTQYLHAAATCTLVLIFVQMILIDRELPFKIATGNAALNYSLAIFFGCALLPCLLLDALFFSLIAVMLHAALVTFFSPADLLINSFYVFHTVVAMTIGAFVGYWREWFLRSGFLNPPLLIRAGARGANSSRGRIFISYRRSDSDAIAGRIRDRLALQFGDGSVFMDIDNIPPGVDFRTHIRSALAEADAAVVVIGTDWLDAEHGGHRRIDDPEDPVRTELEAALTRNIPVIPVLVRGAKMPSRADLPGSLGELSFRNAADVDSGKDFHLHMERVIRSLERALDPSAATPIFSRSTERRLESDW